LAVCEITAIVRFVILSQPIIHVWYSDKAACTARLMSRG
jgi:hypothetical protein